MSIKEAVSHIQDELKKVELAGLNLPHDFYEYLLTGIHKEIQDLESRIWHIRNRVQLGAQGASSATDALPEAQNGAQAVEEPAQAAGSAALVDVVP